jgi:hypothetical protein
MKPCKINAALLVIEADDLYFIESRNRWFPVPKHWIGDFVSSHSYAIAGCLSTQKPCLPESSPSHALTHRANEAREAIAKAERNA